MSVIDTADTPSRIKTARRGSMRSVNRPERRRERPRPERTEPTRPTRVRLIPRSSMIGEASITSRRWRRSTRPWWRPGRRRGPCRIDIPGPYPGDNLGYGNPPNGPDVGPTLERIRRAPRSAPRPSRGGLRPSTIIELAYETGYAVSPPPMPTSSPHGCCGAPTARTSPCIWRHSPTPWA